MEPSVGRVGHTCVKADVGVRKRLLLDGRKIGAFGYNSPEEIREGIGRLAGVFEKEGLLKG